MSTDRPPQGGSSGAPPAPVAVQQTTVIQMGTHKNVGGAVLLAFLFGPLGMLYATITGGVVMFFVNIVVAFLTLGLGLFFTIPLGMVWAGMAASSHNKQLQAVTTHQASEVAASAGPPAAWHDDPDGSGRLRFYDGTRWTDHYAEKPGQPSNEPIQPAARPDQLPPVAEEPEAATTVIEEEDEDVTVVLKSADPARASCTSCSHEIDPQARFCSACGQAQATA